LKGREDSPDSEGATGFVSRVHADGTFDINLSVGGIEKNVHPRRIQNSTPLATTARRRSIADDSATRPSLIFINHVPSRRSSPVTIAADVSTIATNKNNTNNQRHDFATVAIHQVQVIQQCDGWHPKYSNNKSKKLWELLQKGWNGYPEEKIARLFVHQTQVAAAILQCNGGDEFVQERNGLSYGVRRVCTPLMEGDEDHTRNLATMEAPTRKV